MHHTPVAIIQVRLQPGAGENRIIGIDAGQLRARVTAPPEGGKANKALIELLADRLHIAKGRVRILRGHSSRLKQVEIEGIDQESIGALLGS